VKYSEKTIPYRLSPAELENLRILRQRTQASGSMPNDEEAKRSSEGNNARNSEPDPLEKKTVRKSV